MGKKGHNWKARRVVDDKDIKIDRSEEKKIKLDTSSFQDAKYDDSNLLVLPSEKRKTKIKSLEQAKHKILTKKQKKNLEKLVESKKKKLLRNDLLKKLESVQATEEELSMMISTSQMQTGHHVTNKKVLAEIESENGTKALIGSLKVKKIKNNIFAGVIRKKNSQILNEIKKNNDESSNTDTSDFSTDEENNNIEAENIVNNNNNITENITETNNDTNELCIKKGINNIDLKIDKSSIDNDANKKVVVDKVECCIPKKEETSFNESKNEKKTVINVQVFRDSQIEMERQKLPVYREEQQIIEAINENPVVIICGETGSGKTTQVPQFLYEAGYASNGRLIGITEPRRVAAICMAKRVAHEMNLSLRKVSYQIRYEGTTNDETQIKFMTDGVLLKEVQTDFELEKYSVIILDEAHERSVYTDILIGLLSRIVKLRQKRGNPLKLIIMSATLRVADFTENERLFKIKPPVIEITSRQYPVTIHFNKKTNEDYLQEAYKKICKIQRKLPDGGILVFVTSQQEVHTLCSKLKRTFPSSLPSEHLNTSNPITPKSDKELCVDGDRNETSNNNFSKNSIAKISLDNFPSMPMDEDIDADWITETKKVNSGQEDNVDEYEDCLLASDSDGNEDDDNKFETFQALEKESKKPKEQTMYVLPLYSLLAPNKQAKVFEPIKPGCRLCVVATNVAETSLTIPGIKYVVDTGKVKTKFYDLTTGVSTFHVTYISQASANQRSGRAGRIGPGHCYRLYSSAVFNDFDRFSLEEIKRRPIEDLVLQMKDIGIERVINFPFPSPPPSEAILAAEKLLYRLGALQLSNSHFTDKRIKGRERTYILTKLGQTMAKLPVSPRHSKMLALAHQHGLLPYVVAMVAAMSVQELFVDPSSSMHDLELAEERKAKWKQSQELRRMWLGKSRQSLLLGDAMLVLKAICKFEQQEKNNSFNQFSSNNPNNVKIEKPKSHFLLNNIDDDDEFCIKYNIRPKSLIEARKLRKQLTNTLNEIIPALDLDLDPKLPAPTSQQLLLLRQIILSGFVDHIAKRLPDMSGLSIEEAKKRKNAYEDTILSDPVFIHPSSVLFKSRPEYVVYHFIEETSKLYMKSLTAIEPEWLPIFVPAETRSTNPKLDNPLKPPRYDQDSGHVTCEVSATFGAQFWKLPVYQEKLGQSIECCRWFGQFLLDGSVCPKMKPFVEHMLANPITMTKSWAHLQPRTNILLQALVDAGVYNFDTLSQAWKHNPQYLLREICEWLPENQKSTLTAIWPPL